jgi:MFS family permease
MGSARAVNRRYISDCVPSKLRIKASAGFVSASALGMACGPALAGLLQWNFKLSFLTFNEDTLPGWVMAFAWLVYLAWLWVFFKEPVFSAGTPPAEDFSSGFYLTTIVIILNSFPYHFLNICNICTHACLSMDRHKSQNML